MIISDVDMITDRLSFIKQQFFGQVIATPTNQNVDFAFNAIENLIPFAVLVIVAHLTTAANDATAAACITYFWARLAHYVFYISNIPFTRTLTFTIGWLSMICIFWQIVT